MSLASSHENRLLLDTVRAFMKAELHPHEDLVDRLGEVPLDLGRQIEKRAMAAGLYAANLPEEVGGGGLGLEAKTLMENKATGMSTVLMRWAPGAKLPDHEHVAIEQTYVIEGSFRDHDGICRAGNCTMPENRATFHPSPGNTSFSPTVFFAPAVRYPTSR